MPPPPCRPRWTAPACSSPIRSKSPRFSTQSSTTPRRRDCSAQNEALARLRAKDFDGTLLRFVDQVLSAPRKAPAVAWDFWDQFRMAEELHELQQYRPAIFRALPESPESKAGLVEEKR
jgi:hypothetical protein